MLSSIPIGASPEAIDTWQRLGPLTVAQFKQKKLAAVDVTGQTTLYTEWRSPLGDQCFGQVKKLEGELVTFIRDGIVRRIDSGSVSEAQYAADKLHGYLRVIKADGSYQTSEYKGNLLDGPCRYYKSDGALWIEHLFKEGEIVERRTDPVEQSEQPMKAESRKLMHVTSAITVFRKPIDNVQKLHGPNNFIVKSRNKAAFASNGGSLHYDSARSLQLVKHYTFEGNPYDL